MQNSFFIFLNKPIGLTSQQCLSRFKRKYNLKKLGHHGTLDPFADGLLLVGVNEATKFFSYVLDEQKTYEGSLSLGSATDTLDCTGEVVAEKPVSKLDITQIIEIAETFVGLREQVPPMYSAVKINGKKLYEHARQGQTVERKSRQVTIHEFAILDYNETTIRFRATVSRGTYIRVLAEELAKKLGTEGHLTALTRTHLCRGNLEQAFDMAADEIPESLKLPISELLEHCPKLQITEEQVKELFFGREITFDAESSKEGDQALLLHGDQIVGMGEYISAGILRSRRLMSQNDYNNNDTK
jgi:tRNA pseudouridine55 synthase